MNFLVISVGLLATVAGLPFPQEFAFSPTSQAPPPGPAVSENNRAFRVQQIVPEGNTVTKVVVQVPNESAQRTQGGFQLNHNVRHYYPENENFPKENHQSIQQSHHQPVQRVQYIPQGIPENMPHLFLPARPVAQSVEQIPQSIHHSVQRVQQVPQRTQQPQHNVVQEINQPVTNIQSAEKIPFTNGQEVINEQQPVNVQQVEPSIAVQQSSKDHTANQESQEIYHKTQHIQSVVQAAVQETGPSVQNVPADRGSYQTYQQVQSEQFPQDQKIQQASQDTFKPQRTPEVQHNGPGQTVVTVQHGPNGVHIIRQGEQNVQHQQNLLKETNEQSQNNHKIENTYPVQPQPEQAVHHGAHGVQIISQGEYFQQQKGPTGHPTQIQTSDNAQHVSQNTQQLQISDQREQFGTQPLAKVVQNRSQGFEIIRQEGYTEKPVQQQVTQTNHQRTNNVVTVQHSSQTPNVQTDQREQNQVNQQAAFMVQHGPSRVHIIRQGEHSAQQHQNRVQQNVPSHQTSQREENAVNTAQPPTPGIQHIPKDSIHPTQDINQAEFQVEAEKIPPGVQRIPQVQVPYEAEVVNTVAQNTGTQVEQSQVSHFSFGIQDQEAHKKEADQKQEIHPKPQASEPVSENFQLLPTPHKVAQNMIVQVPEVSQTIKESTLVQAIPSAAYQVSHGVQQLSQGVQQAVQYVNSIHRDKPNPQQVRHEVEQNKKEAPFLEQENRQIPFQQEDFPQSNQNPLQSGLNLFQNQGQRGQAVRPQYGSRKPVQSAPVNQIPHRVESPADDDAHPTPIPIIRYENSVSPDGTYQWSYEAGNGITAEESGLLRNRGEADKEAIAVQGGYSYTGPDGIFYSVEYIADENGFRPLGRHLPTQPPIPEALQRAIDEHMAILATAKPDTTDEPVQTDNKLSASQNNYNYS